MRFILRGNHQRRGGEGYADAAFGDVVLLLKSAGIIRAAL